MTESLILLMILSKSEEIKIFLIIIFLYFKTIRVDYEYNADDDEFIILTVHVFKHMDSSLINLDIQPNYVRVILKGKALQLALSEEVKPDSSTAQRSQTTGHLVIKMPKLNIDRDKLAKKKSNDNSCNQNKEHKKIETKSNNNYLEVDPTLNSNRIDLSQIVKDANTKPANGGLISNNKRLVKERDNSPSFVDSDDVPPLM
jgi:protein TilB